MKTEMMMEFWIVLAASFGLTALLGRRLIPILKSKKIGQKILDIGPRWHKSKEGTPTMGGVIFIAAMTAVIGVALAVSGIFREQNVGRALCVLSLGLMNGVVGYIDDRAKLLKKQNEGLLAWQKYLLQLVAAAIFLFLWQSLGYGDTSLIIPYFGVMLELGFGYYIVALLLITGMVNSVNLTDGIDGLASTLSLVVGGFFAFVGFSMLSRPLSLLSGALIGGMLGFLVYNFHPARVFMGDTGSLFLGGLLTGMAFLMGSPLLILICGLVFVLETVSVMLQVGVFRLSGRKKRLFRMAPIHHHFEKCGWGEIKIVVIFSLLTLGCCVLAWLGL